MKNSLKKKGCLGLNWLLTHIIFHTSRNYGEMGGPSKTFYALWVFMAKLQPEPQIEHYRPCDPRRCKFLSPMQWGAYAEMYIL